MSALSLVRFKRTRIPSVEEGQWDRLGKLFSKVGFGFMPHDIGNRVGLHYREAHAIILALVVKGALDSQWLVYHQCSPEPLDSIPFKEGFVRLPWVCPDCEVAVTSEEELRYNLYSKTLVRVEFV